MKKQILFALVLSLTFIVTKAQGPSYTDAEYGVAGDSLFYTSVTVDTSTLNFALAGANITWNFSTLAPTTQFNDNYLAPATAGYRAAFLAECTAAGGTAAHCLTEFNALANLAFKDQKNVAIQGTEFTNVINNDLKTATELEENILGVTTKVNGVNVPFVAVYTSPDVIYKFPISYGNRDTSVSAYTIDLSGHGIDFIYHAHNTRVSYDDAYGSLTSPHATYAATVRHRSYILHTDTLIYNSAVIPIPPSTTFEYDWFNTSYIGPVFTASGTLNGTQENFTTVTYLDTIHCLAPRAAQHHDPEPGIIDPSVGDAIINFVNTSTNANSYTWNFDDPSSGAANTSTSTDPTHTYDAAGLYQAVLIACNTACNPAQCDTDTFNVNVVDSGALRALFVITPAVACIGDTVKFTNTSTNATSYFWNFGDQNTSTLKSPKHIYALPGTYTVTLVASNGITFDTVTRSLTVNSLPDAQIGATGPTTFCHGDSVTLYASGGTIYHWSTGHVGATIKVKASGTFTVTATNSCGSSTSLPITVTVNTPVDTVIVSGDTAICAGDSVKLTVNTGSGATYQWRLNDQIITGATQTTYYAKTTGNYKANVIVNGCEGVSNIIHITVNAAPTAAITTPGGLTAFCSGDSLKITATTGAGYTYQWQNSGVNISGATAASYYAKTSGTYTNVVTHNGCSAISNSIIITSIATPAPAITAQGGASTCQGDSVYLTTAAGNGYNYQWLLNGTAINGATLPFVYAKTAGSYAVEAIAGGCTGTSTATVVTINPAPVANAGAAQSIAGCSSVSSITLGGSPTASGGTGPYTYKWTPTSGLNDSIIANPVVSGIGSTTNYTVVVTDNKGCTAQSSVLITVTGSTMSVSIAATGDTTWCAGTNGSVGLAATPTGGTGPYVYTWTPSTGLSVTTGAATTASPTAAGIYTYQVLATASGGCQASSSIIVTVDALPVATITSLDTTAPCAGDTVHFVASPGAGYAYQWLAGGTPISGASGISYATIGGGTYSVSVTAGVCSAPSTNSIIVTVRPNPTASAGVHGGTAICEGSNTALIANVVNGYTYQWYDDGFGIAGATAGDYIASDSGTYYVVETLNGCSETSNSITVTVQPYPVDTIVAEGATSFCTGGNVVLDVSTGPGYAYQWLENGNYISGANDSVITATTTGVYTALVTFGSCSSTSTGIPVTIYAYPLANLTNTGQLSFCTGDSVTLNITDSSDYNYIWLVTANGETDTLPNVTPSIVVGDSGLYNVVVTDNTCSSTSNSLYATELPLPDAAAGIVAGDGFVCPGDTVTIAAGAGFGYTYQWQDDGNNITGATGSTLTVTDSGTYAVLVTGGGCVAASNYAIVSYDSCVLGIPGVVESQSILLSPNPAHNTSLLTFTCSQWGTISVKLYDLLGAEIETIYEGQTMAGKNFYSIPMSNLAAGMYVLRIYNGSAIVSKKIIKE